MQQMTFQQAIYQLGVKMNSILQGENKCPSAKENGVSILHGNALAFVKVTPIKAITIISLSS